MTARDRIFDACPHCPFCGLLGGPELVGDPGHGQLNWRCEECGEEWRMKRGPAPSLGEMSAHLTRTIRAARVEQGT